MRTQDIGCLSYAEAVTNSLTEASLELPTASPQAELAAASPPPTAPSTALDPGYAAEASIEVVDPMLERTHSRSVSMSDPDMRCLSYAETLINTRGSPLPDQQTTAP